MVVLGIITLLIALLAFKLLKGGFRLIVGGVTKLRGRA